MVLAIAGCGGDDALTGSWSNTACFGTKTKPEGIKDCKTSLTFTDDLKFSLKAEQMSEPATAMAPGCTTTRLVEEQTWSTDGESFTLEGAGKATLARSSCVNASDEFPATATTDIVVPAGRSGYVITDNSLTIAAGPLAGTYTK
ncbi:MAG: hypothetical protein ABI134_02140 [Byssovorax sp.]